MSEEKKLPCNDKDENTTPPYPPLSKGGSERKKDGCNCGCNCKKHFIIAIVIVAIVLLVVFFTSDVPTSSQDMGLGDYTQEELDKMYPQVQNADVETRTTPEQTYAKLKQALLDEDIEIAVSCFAAEVRGEYNDIFLKADNDGNLQNLGKVLPEKITEVYISDAIAQYEAPQIVDEYETMHTFNFNKDNNGDWKIESL